LGSAVSFDGSNEFIYIADDASLDLSAGYFSIAAWINPNPASAYESENCILWRDYAGGVLCDQFLPEGIMGWNSGSPDAYPSLQRQLVFDEDVDGYYANRLRFGFADEDGWVDYYNSPAGVLPDEQWNFVVLTFAAGTVKLYVNGELVDQDAGIFAGKTPTDTKYFEIGRSSHTGQVEFGDVYINHAGYDQGGGDNEFCMAFDGSSVFDRQIDEDNQYPIGESREFQNAGTLHIWEDDTGTTCGSSANSGDQAIDSWTISITGPSTGRIPLGDCLPGPDWGDFNSCHAFSGEVGGYLSYKYQHDSSPFNGEIDEVQIYRSVLDAGTIGNMYWGMSMALHLELDQPPGESLFSDSSPADQAGTCTDVGGSGCPTTGLSGRINRAAGFTAAERDHIKLDDFGNFTQATVSAWVYPTGSTGARQAIVSYKESADCGFQLALAENDGQFYPEFKVRVLSGLTANWQTLRANVSLAANQWTHLAGVYDGAELLLYQNGALLATISAPGAMSQCSTDTALGSSSSSTQDYFAGQIDDVFIFSQALSAAEIEEIYQAAPVFQMKFDENYGATQFIDAANSGNHGVCNAHACPDAGFAIEGQLDYAAEFDSLNDVVVVESDAALTLEHFTVGAWVYPTATRANDQEIVMKGLWAPATSAQPLFTNYRLFIEGESLIPSVEFSQFCSDQYAKATSEVPLIKDHWNHLMATFDGKFLHLYLNGSEQAFWQSDAYDTVSPCQVDDVLHALQIGGLTEYDQVWGHGFAGRLDEVTLYSQALSDAEVYSIYQYQNGWVQQQQRANIVVDDDLPTVSLHTPASYLPLAAVQLLATAADDTSGVGQVNFGSCQDADNCTPDISGPVTLCEDSAGDGAWCPLFEPAAEGRHTLGVNASDKVGNPSQA
ncbi:MAG: LamG domain-containing protein, partial [Anaerolineales bacterium]|nr:LamG domain-containing protein [Anaerolineales bacterium]